MTAVAQLKALLGMDNKQFKAGMRDSTASAKSFGSSIAQIGGTLAAAFSIRAIAQFTKSVVSFASEIRHTADNLNVSTDSLQALNSVALKYGVTVEDLQKGLAKLRQSQGKVVEKDKEYLDALKLLKIKAEEFGNVGTDKALEMIAKAYTKSGQSALAFSGVMDLMGRSAKKSTAFLVELADVGLGGMIRSAKTAGDVINEQMITRLELAGTRMDQLKLKMKTLFAKLITPGEGGGVRLSAGVLALAEREGLLDEPAAAAGPAEMSDAEKSRRKKLAALRAEFDEKSYLRELKAASPEDRLTLLKAEADFIEQDQLAKNNSAEQLYALEFKRWKVVDEIAATEKKIADTKAKSAKSEQARLDKISAIQNSAFSRIAEMQGRDINVQGQGIQANSLARVGGFVGPQRGELGIADRQIKLQVELKIRAEERNITLKESRDDIRIIKEQMTPRGELN